MQDGLQALLSIFRRLVYLRYFYLHGICQNKHIANHFFFPVQTGSSESSQLSTFPTSASNDRPVTWVHSCFERFNFSRFAWLEFWQTTCANSRCQLELNLCILHLHFQYHCSCFFWDGWLCSSPNHQACIYPQHRIVMWNDTSRKGAMKRPPFVNVVGRWAQSYPYVTTISIVFYDNSSY